MFMASGREASRIAALEAELAALKQQQQQPNSSRPKTQDELDDEAIMALDESALCGTATPPLAQRDPNSQPLSSPPPAAPPPTAPPAGGPIPRDPKLAASLLRFFGYDEFREGQEDVVNAVLAQRDVAVFWATGRGKSLCYQLPALHMGKTAVVVSPLVSLMQDQVTKANYQQGREVAALLGSAQLDSSVEARAWRGDFPLLYLTPEKIACGGIDQLVQLHQAGKLLLAAVDEAHCVSEWGHDFRKDYRGLHVLRERMPDLPIIALTATAVPAVQADIRAALRLREPVYLSQQSAFRRNLAIACTRKMHDGVRADLQPLLGQLRGKGGKSGSVGSTVVYCPTKKRVEEVCAILTAAGVDADFYHAGRPHAARHDVHMRFLSGATPVIVATVAFGMGIDKPDIRRVVHYGAPKTVEEYYQQIGRAGRDGGPAECVLICNDSDFAAYSSDFYTAELSAHAREIVTASTERLRAFASDGRTCRWIKLLTYLGEPRAQACGSCDNCRNKEQHKGDTERDFGPVARVLLSALSVCSGQSWTHVEKAVAQHSLTAQLQPRRGAKVLKEFLPGLEIAGLVLRKTVKGAYGAYDVYSTTPQGQHVLRGLAGAAPPPLMLPVPASVREEDRKAREAADRVKAEVEAALKGLAARGVDVAEVPESELQPNAEQTPVTTAILHYFRQLKQWRESGKTERAEAHEALHGSVVAWRAAEAKRVGMAPGAIFADHVAMKLVLVKPTSTEALKIAGARLSADGARALLDLVAEWQLAHGSGSSQASASQGGASSQGGGGSQQSASGGGEAAEVLAATRRVDAAGGV